MENNLQVNHSSDEIQVKERIKSANDNRDEVIFYHLDQVHYWLIRFEVSREVDHLDNAERNAEVARLYLPVWLRDLDLIGLRNLYWSLSAKQASNEGGYCNQP